MIKGIAKLKKRFEEDPVTVTVVVAFAAYSASRLLDAMSTARMLNERSCNNDCQVR